MSMSMNCFAVKPADEDYKRKAAAYHACRAAKVPIPKELDEFFNGEEPDPTGVTQRIGNDFFTRPATGTRPTRAAASRSTSPNSPQERASSASAAAGEGY